MSCYSVLQPTKLQYLQLKDFLNIILEMPVKVRFLASGERIHCFWYWVFSYPNPPRNTIP